VAHRSIELLLLIEVELVIVRDFVSRIFELLSKFNFIRDKRHVEANIGIFKFKPVVLVVEEFGGFLIAAVNNRIVIFHFLDFVFTEL
jgi:hypothetical protein